MKNHPRQNIQSKKNPLILSAKKEALLLILLLTGFILLGFIIWQISPDPQTFLRYGLIGVFLAAIASSATILFPAPGLLIAFIAGGFMPPLWVGIISGLGAGLGELSGYWIGRRGEFLIDQLKGYRVIKRWMVRYGGWIIFVGACIPNPIFDVVGMTAGSTAYPLKKFLISVIAGKSVRSIVAAFAGAYSIDWIARILGL